jgi:large subunit ribosomal protein L6
MSRIGKMPISLPANVTATVEKNNNVIVKGPLGELHQQVDAEMTIEVNDGIVEVKRPTDQKRHRAMHGLYRSLINNMVIGVAEGYTTKQEFVGVGYKAETKGQMLEMSLGYSHNYVLELPKEIKAEAVTERRQNPILTMKSHDKQLLGMVAAKIRSFRPPEPYKGKGIKYVGEELRRKAGKSAAK